ncbi:hypothetical protein [Myceligenerans crystallogenes]|uniref:Uncharacterized protein n=1 Tax=Myceligenerans crystallogenes TaxID=316335 RepID=A0ABN2NCP0_9MICO
MADLLGDAPDVLLDEPFEDDEPDDPDEPDVEPLPADPSDEEPPEDEVLGVLGFDAAVDVDFEFRESLR